MEHPQISVKKIKKDLTLEQIQEKISELRTKLNFSYGTGNQPLINQLSMALECYERAQNEIITEMFSDSDIDPSDNININ